MTGVLTGKDEDTETWMERGPRKGTGGRWPSAS